LLHEWKPPFAQLSTFGFARITVVAQMVVRQMVVLLMEELQMGVHQ
jgi:hypothetical protein